MQLTVPIKKMYQTPEIEQVLFDTDFSLQLTSGLDAPGDVSSNNQGVNSSTDPFFINQV